MGHALTLARETVGLASPNPQVSCVLMQGDKTIGEGAHLYDQLDHAEIVALKAARAAGHATAGATAYVTLEPCSHYGRTGPCADALVEARIARCVVATEDPNPQVSGRGVAKLRAAGISVEVGVLKAEARGLNDAFACSITQGRPLVTLKSALSVDGRIAPAPGLRHERAPVYLTGAAALQEVQQLRHASDAILTGIGTVLADDPLLTDRSGLPRRRPLLRIVLDRDLRIPVESRLVASANRDPARQDLWIFTSELAAEAKIQGLRDAGVLVTRVRSSGAGLSLEEILRHLAQAKVLSVLLETGAGLTGSFLEQELIDRVILYYSERELGVQAVPFARNGITSFALQQRLSRLETQPVGADVRISGYFRSFWPA